jgi:putative aldouronate transport system substrate-binding protein
MKRSRLFVFLLVAALVLAGGAAFANGKADTAALPDNSGGVVYNGKGPIAKAGTTITVLSINSYYSSADLVTAPIIKELTKRAGITVNYQLLPPGNYADAMKPRLAAGSDLPDIVYLPDKDPTMKYIKGKLFIPINTLYDKYGINLKKLYAGTFSYVKPSLTTPDGLMYYVPQLGLGMNYQPDFMVNERWLAKLGLSDPTTIDEFTAMLKAFRDKDPNGNGQKDEIPLSIEKGFLRQAFSPMFGLDLVSGFQADKNGKVFYGFTSPLFKEYLAYLNMLYTEKLLDPDFATTTMDQENARFAKNITGADFHFSWLMSQGYSTQFKDYDGKTPIVKGILPIKGPHGDRYYLGRDSITGMFGISKDSKLPDIAFKFLDLAISDDSQVLYNWGIEGDTFVTKDGKRVYTGKDNDYLQKFGIDPVNLPLIQFTAMAEGILPKWHVDYDYAVAPYMKGVWPFVYSLDDEASVENQYMTDINTYVDEMELKFITGTEPLANFDKFVATLKNMNVDKVTAARQAQWDRYQKAMKK